MRCRFLTRRTGIGLLSHVTIFFAFLISAEATTFSIIVPTRAPHNANAVVWCHVPEGYDPSAKRMWRVLVYFGGRNCTGEKEAKGNLGWRKWADANGVFLVCPGFKDDEYWEPKKWSGKALFQAIAELSKSYKIDANHLFYYGYSAGSQAANLFAAWRPEKCRGWVSHACGVFHEPRATMRGIPGLVTCGDVDAGRFVIGRAFVAKARKQGENVIWKTFPNRPHDVPAGSLELARAFFSYCSSRFKADLDPYKMPEAKRVEHPAPFVGDDADGTYWPRESPFAAAILPEDVVLLPSEEVAAAWGRPGEEAVPVGRDAGGR